MNALGVLILELQELPRVLRTLAGYAVAAVLLVCPWLAQAVVELCVDPWLAQHAAGRVECVQVKEAADGYAADGKERGR